MGRKPALINLWQHQKLATNVEQQHNSRNGVKPCAISGVPLKKRGRLKLLVWSTI